MEYPLGALGALGGTGAAQQVGPVGVTGGGSGLAVAAGRVVGRRVLRPVSAASWCEAWL